jgi:hypothetical protein
LKNQVPLAKQSPARGGVLPSEIDIPFHGPILGSFPDSGRPFRGMTESNFGRSGGAPARLFVRVDVSKAFNSWQIRVFQSTMAPNRDIKYGMPGIDWPLV